MTAMAPTAPGLVGPHSRSPRVVVVGAGLGGLATALRLLAAGCEVTVLESQPGPGGRAGQIREQGFTFDTGPSLITMPQLLDELFQVAGTTTAAQLRMHRLEPFYRIRWRGDPRSFAFSSDQEAMLEEIGRFSATDASRYLAFLDHSRAIYEKAILAAGRRPFLTVLDFVGLVPEMVRLGALRSVDHFVASFFRDPHVRQAFSFHPLFIGGDPFRVPAVYAALAYLQIDSGVWYSEGGVYALVKALAQLVGAGGRIRLGTKVDRVLLNGGRVSGVRTIEGEIVPADVVVSNGDVVATRRLLAGADPRRDERLSMSCFLLYLGTRRQFPQLAHHTLLVGHDYPGFIRAVTRRGQLGASASLYLHAPVRTEPAMAPARGDAISVLLPVPNLSSQLDWEQAEAMVRELVLEAMEAESGLGLSGLRDSIVMERVWTPIDFRDRLGAARGNAFGPEPTLLQSAYFRQPNRSRRVAGLYHVGQGTHPGAGIPGVLLGAEVTSRLVLEEVASWR